MIYLDHNATTPVLPEVLEALLPFMRERFGNPSSIHWAGRMVKGALEEAREQVAGLVGCDGSELVFTSCGTEASNMAIKGVVSALRDRGRHIITTRVEHPAVTNTCLYLEKSGYDVTWLDVDERGLPSLEQLESAITDQTVLISVMYANNETGVVMPVREIGEIAARKRVYFHCDAVQAAGRIPVDLRKDGVTLLSLSGHKLYAPKGVGALAVRKGTKMHPFIHGGSQERNRRAGTENLPGIVGFGKACELAGASMAQESRRLAGLRDRLEEGILALIPHVRINGHGAERLPNTSNISIADVDADTLLVNLDLAGIAVSSGSACSSGTLKASPVLAAMGVPPAYARGSIRFSFGKENGDEDMGRVLQILPELVERLRKG